MKMVLYVKTVIVRIRVRVIRSCAMDSVLILRLIIVTVVRKKGVQIILTAQVVTCVLLENVVNHVLVVKFYVMDNASYQTRTIFIVVQKRDARSILHAQVVRFVLAASVESHV